MTATIPAVNRQVLLRRRPDRLLDETDIELVESPMPEIDEGQALAQVLALGMDAATRAWMQESDGYLPAVELGEVVRGAGVARVVASSDPEWPEGTIVGCLSGWQEWMVVEPGVFPTSWPPDTDPLGQLAVFGSPGAVAYFGLTDVADVREGDDVVMETFSGKIWREPNPR